MRPLYLLLFMLLLAPCASARAEDTEQLIQQGRQVLEAGQAEQAGLIFERILLEQPWRLGVWLDYALSLQQLGDNDSARAIYQSLLRQDPPEHLAPWLRRQIQITTPPRADWQHAGTITLLAGYDGNLNRAPASSSLTLTLPSGALVLPLTDASRASAGPSHLMRLDWQAARQETARGDWLLQATLNARMAPGANGQDYLQSGVGLMRRWAGAPGGEYHAILSAQNLQYNGNDLQHALRAGLYRGQPWRPETQAGCSSSHGAEWERLAYPSAGELDGQYLGIAAGLGCKQGINWQLLLRAGLDQAEQQRPGSDQQRINLRGQVDGPLGAGQWIALSELTLLRDSSGYSPLLENNATRHIRHWLLKVEYQHPLGAGLHALASAETFSQDSNLPLFTLRGSAGWLGIRYRF